MRTRSSAFNARFARAVGLVPVCSVLKHSASFSACFSSSCSPRMASSALKGLRALRSCRPLFFHSFFAGVPSCWRSCLRACLSACVRTFVHLCLFRAVLSCTAHSAFRTRPQGLAICDHVKLMFLQSCDSAGVCDGCRTSSRSDSMAAFPGLRTVLFAPTDELSGCLRLSSGGYLFSCSS